MELDDQCTDHRPSMPEPRHRQGPRPTAWHLCLAPAISALHALAVASWPEKASSAAPVAVPTRRARRNGTKWQPTPRGASPRRVEATRRARPAPPAATGTTSPPLSGRASRLAQRNTLRSEAPDRLAAGALVPLVDSTDKGAGGSRSKSKGGRARLAAWIGQRSPETLHRHDGGGLRHRARRVGGSRHRPRLGHRRKTSTTVWRQRARHEARAGKRRQRDHSRVVVGLR